MRNRGMGDGNYDGWFEEVCFSGQCLAQESGCSIDESNSWCHFDEARSRAQIATCRESGTSISYADCGEREYCKETNAGPRCEPWECDPGSPAQCLRSSPPARQRYEAWFAEAQEAGEVDANVEGEFQQAIDDFIVVCNEFGSGYEEIEVEFESGSCGEEPNLFIVNEGTEDEERWAGRGCESGDERTSEHEAKDCYAFDRGDGEWEDGVCTDTRNRNPNERYKCQ